MNYVRIESVTSIFPAKWSGKSATMYVSSANFSKVDVEVIGISFTKNSTLVIKNLKNSDILVKNCSFSQSMRNRVLSLEASGRVVVKDSVFIGNIVGGGGEIQGQFFFSFAGFCRE